MPPLRRQISPVAYSELLVDRLPEANGRLVRSAVEPTRAETCSEELRRDGDFDV